MLALLALAVFVWLANASGLLSSNDGSHLALARALALRGETTIEPERALTLEVDLAERDGLSYSDRPPGTAFAAMPAVVIGDRLDPLMYARAVGQAKAGRAVDPLPAAKPYLHTYAKRARPGSPRLVELIGTSIAIAIHTALVGLLGLVLIDRLARELELELGARLFALASVALASAWGPYASALFSHVPAATALTGFILGVLVSAARETEDRRTSALLAATGLAGAWAIACDYLLILVVVPVALVAISPRRYLAVLLGTAPIVIATLAYHELAFGSPVAIGYDHHSNFEFARTRGATFSGELLDGLWILWGAGRGAGLLVQAPIVLLGVAGAVGLATRAPSEAAAKVWPRVLAALALWALVLAKHRTPWGGASEDYRYLIPLLPVAGVGLAWVWARSSWPIRAATAIVALASLALTWRQFWSWHDGQPFARLGLGAGAGLAVFALGLVGLAIRRKLRSTALSC